MIGGWLFCGLYLLHQKWWFLALCLGAFTFAAASSSFVLVGKGAMYPPMIVAAFVVCVSFATPQAAVSATLVKTVGIAGGILVSAMAPRALWGRRGLLFRGAATALTRALCARRVRQAFPPSDRPSCLFPPCRRCTHATRAHRQVYTLFSTLLFPRSASQQVRIVWMCARSRPLQERLVCVGQTPDVIATLGTSCRSQRTLLQHHSHNFPPPNRSPSPFGN